MKRYPTTTLALIAASLLLTLLAGCQAGQGDSGGITGTLTADNGHPLAGMEVRVVDGPAGSGSTTAETNLNGHYKIEGLPAGTFEVAIFDREGNEITLQTVTVSAKDVSTLDFVIPLEGMPDTGRLRLVELPSRRDALADMPERRLPAVDLSRSTEENPWLR